ncbi:tripartite tricarboxylate transporter TctB family protein [Ramlibacter terrae]|uniref:Tripartite tricarboxylate transporter TctB family protein n=1 Tax=Ramlibacter terrae TaxID=2732511 RepID=A0ABX6P716_9BURK|nr:tripartite tricarboxylate transporter TctB family protein [Ramlibacter terrae]
MRIVNQKDFAAGAIYVLAGGGFGIGAFNYTIGEAARMGPGYFPLCVGVLLVPGRAGHHGHRRAPPRGHRRPEAARPARRRRILGAVTLFGLLLQPAGLVVALAVLVVVSSMASHAFRWKGTLLNMVVLVAFSIGVFIEGINLQLPLWPTFLR